MSAPKTSTALPAIIAMFLLIGFANPSHAQIPQTIGFQGVLVDESGDPVSDGTYSVVVSLYDTNVGGSALWTEAHASVEITGGFLNVVLGTIEPLTLPFDEPYWLGVSVDSDPELSPRLALTAAPYSLNSRTAIAEWPVGTSLIVRNESGDPVHILNVDGSVRHVGDVLLDEVPPVEPGDLTPPNGMDDENPRVLVWSQADERVRYLSLNTDSDEAGDSDWVEEVIADEVWTGRKIVLRSGGDVFVVDNQNGLDPRVYAESQNANAIEAYSSGNGEGVHGESSASDGVHGLATGQGDGVHGEAEGDGDGVYGEALGDGRGVYGIATGEGEGVLGESEGDGAAVKGLATGAGTAVRGDAQGAGTGVHGSSVGGKAGVFQGDVDILKDTGGGVGHLKFEDIENSMQVNPMRFLIRDGDGVVREAPVPTGPGGGGDADWVDDVPNNQVYTSNKSIRLQVAPGNNPFDVQNGDPMLRLKAEATQDAILGNSTGAGVGVRGESQGSYGVKGTTQAAESAAVYGMKGPAVGVLGESADRHGVKGSTDAVVPTSGTILNTWAAVKGEAESAPAVFGESTNNEGVRGTSDKYYGVIGKSSGVVIQERTAGVYGIGEAQSLGVKGESETKDGVHGTTDGQLQDTNVIAGVHGQADLTYGVRGQSRDEEGVYGVSEKKSGVYGTSVELHGVEGEVSTGDDDIAGVRGVAETTQSGVFGTSGSGPGVRGTSTSGPGVLGQTPGGTPAGQFESEVHILDAGAAAKLKIDSMENDNTAPCVVWSGPVSDHMDDFVRTRDCWKLEEDGETTYMVSDYGIRVMGGEEGMETVFEVNTDGTSTHKGLEIFEAGLQVPDPENDENTLIDLTPGEVMINQRFSVKNTNGTRLIDVNPSLFGQGTYPHQMLGNVMVNGFFTATGGKAFTIDHPVDPLNKVLRHFAVEGPDVLNMYTGNVVLGGDGSATVELPEYFEALNTDYRYQLTSIGAPGPGLYIAEEISDNRFVIAGGQPGSKVSWEVTAVRNDPAAEYYGLEVEEEKSAEMRGRYLNPKAYGENDQGGE